MSRWVSAPLHKHRTAEKRKGGGHLCRSSVFAQASAEHASSRMVDYQIFVITIYIPPKDLPGLQLRECVSDYQIFVKVIYVPLVKRYPLLQAGMWIK